MNCRNCGAEVKDVDRFCGRCGAQIVGEQGQEANSQQQHEQAQNEQYIYQQPLYQPLDTRKSRVVAGVLQIFLGGFGVGRFYLGYHGIAIAQIIVTFLTCGIGALWPFIDGILILANQVQTDADGVPLKD